MRSGCPALRAREAPANLSIDFLVREMECFIYVVTPRMCLGHHPLQSCGPAIPGAAVRPAFSSRHDGPSLGDVLLPVLQELG